MPQHDYIIANGTGASVRSDINGVLQAIASNNSAGTAPSVTYACQLWADTNDNLLKIRDETNSTWIPIAGIGGSNLGIANTVPVGAVFNFASATAPTGYLKCNGDTIPNGVGTVQGVSANFSALYAIVGSTFGSAGKLPDLRGEFIRGWTDGSGVDSGRAFGSAQSSQNLSHTHSGTTVPDGGHSHSVNSNTGLTSSNGSHSHTANTRGGPSSGGTQSGYFSRGFQDGEANTTDAIIANGDHQHNVSIDGVGNHGHGFTTDSGTSSGAEARPRNVAMLACIKY